MPQVTGGEKIYDIAVVGGGASGLTAAIAGGRLGANVAILEKLGRVGKKLLATGNGRCNLGSLSPGENHYGGGMDPRAVFSGFPGEQAFFQSLGLYTRPDEEGRLYPMSNQAASVLDALRLECTRLGVEELCDFPVRDISPRGDGFTLYRDGDGPPLRARRVILSAGGCAGPQYGTGGEGHTLARKLGHRITAPYPALSAIGSDDRSLRALKGMRVHADVTAWRGGGRIKTESGQVQFGDGALSGICVFNLAACRPDTLSLDLIPWCENGEALLADIAARRAHAPLEDYLTGLLPKRVGQALIKGCTELPLTEPVSRMGPEAQKALAARLRDWRFSVRPGENWAGAQVTAGGVTGIGPDLESGQVPGLYFSGEILDVHGDSGGYNLRWAWASGLRVGENAARSLGYGESL